MQENYNTINIKSTKSQPTILANITSSINKHHTTPKHSKLDKHPTNQTNTKTTTIQ